MGRRSLVGRALTRPGASRRGRTGVSMSNILKVAASLALIALVMSGPSLAAVKKGSRPPTSLSSLWRYSIYKNA